MPITVSGTTITFNNGTTQTTAATGSVSSIATGNGLSGGTITTTGTLTIACPGFNTVGSYCWGVAYNDGATSINSGQTYSAGSGIREVQSVIVNFNDTTQFFASNNLSGTWRWMGASANYGGVYSGGVLCRVS